LSRAARRIRNWSVRRKTKRVAQTNPHAPDAMITGGKTCWVFGQQGVRFADAKNHSPPKGKRGRIKDSQSTSSKSTGTSKKKTNPRHVHQTILRDKSFARLLGRGGGAILVWRDGIAGCEIVGGVTSV